MESKEGFLNSICGKYLADLLSPAARRKGQQPLGVNCVLTYSGWPRGICSVPRHLGHSSSNKDSCVARPTWRLLKVEIQLLFLMGNTFP